MKSTSLFIAAMAFLTPVLVFARSNDSANFDLDQPVKVAGSQLAPGQYKLVWAGNGPAVTVSFLEGKITVATAAAHLVKNPTHEEAIETSTMADNTTVLQAVDLKKITLKFENEAPSAGN